MKKDSTKKQDDYELRAEYDLSKMTILPRGRFDPKRRTGKNLVVLDADVAKAFRGDKTVNEALPPPPEGEQDGKGHIRLSAAAAPVTVCSINSSLAKWADVQFGKRENTLAHWFLRRVSASLDKFENGR